MQLGVRFRPEYDLRSYCWRDRYHCVPTEWGSLEASQEMANHSDPRTTKLYDHRKDLATLSEIERRIAF